MLTLLKLGGALLTDKGAVEAIRGDVLQRVAAEVASWPGGRAGRLVIAHGSGSFAHVAVQQTGFLDHPADPRAFAAVAAAAGRLHRHVVDALVAAGVNAVGVPGGALATLEGGDIVDVRADLVAALLARGLVPVTYGDAAIDRTRGGGIASTEPILVALAAALGCDRLIFATDVDGVYDRDPAHDPTARPFAQLSPDTVAEAGLGGARAGATDVTGGMAAKVGAALALVAVRPTATVRILSGLRAGAVAAALAQADGGVGDAPGGTLIVGHRRGADAP